MYFYKLLKVEVYPDSIKYKVSYFNSTFYIVKSDKFFIREDYGYILNPVYDSTTRKLIGFIDA